MTTARSSAESVLAVVVGEPGEQPGAAAELHPAFGIHDAQTHRAGANPWGQGGDQRPHHTAFTGTGGTGNQDMVAQNRHSPPPPRVRDAHYRSTGIGGRGGRWPGQVTRRGQCVAVVQGDPQFSWRRRADRYPLGAPCLGQRVAALLPVRDALAGHDPHRQLVAGCADVYPLQCRNQGSLAQMCG